MFPSLKIFKSRYPHKKVKTTYTIRNRWTNKKIFKAKINCYRDSSDKEKLGLAVVCAHTKHISLRAANLRGAILRGSDLHGADFSYSDLCDADLSRSNLLNVNLCDVSLRGTILCNVDLRGADLRGADLTNAYLCGSDLHSVNLRGVGLRGTDLYDTFTFCIGTRSDGYTFYAQDKGDSLWILAGCRYLSIDDAKKHWKDTRGGTQLGDESLQLLYNAHEMNILRKGEPYV